MTVDEKLKSAISHYQAKRLAPAELLCRQILAVQPDRADALHLLGVLAVHAGRPDTGIELIQRAIRSCKTNEYYHNNLGNALRASGRLDEAIAAYGAAIQINHDFVAAHSNLGVVLKDKGQLDEAIAMFREAIRLGPEAAEAHNGLGVALQSRGQIESAIASFRKALRFQPDLCEALGNLGNALRVIGQLDEAIAACRQAIQLRPNTAELHSHLANVLKARGELEEAIESYREAVRLKPNCPKTHSALIFALSLHPSAAEDLAFDELRRWNQRHAETLRRFARLHQNNRDPNRPLRVGYVSPDFRNHVVGHQVLLLLRHHDRKQIEPFCYTCTIGADGVTESIRQSSDGWRNIAAMSDSEAADLIRKDEIDILVDLAVHSANNRLLIFAHKPAPVQLTYLGYCGSTGMNSMDYRLSDPFMDPSDSDLSRYSEQTIRLPETYWCYNVAGPTPEPSPPPALTLGYVTFGCFNNFSKVSAAALDLWADIVLAVEKSRLIIHSNPGTHLDTLRRRFLDRGIAPDRLEFLKWQSWAQYIGTYDRIDVGLDTFPWGGGITTCDAMWMGVPVVTLAGRTAVGRGGASILSNVGLTDLIAATPQQYSQIAIALASDLPRLNQLRQALRQRMQASPLMDAPRFARNVEAVYRQLWHDWCRK